MNEDNFWKFIEKPFKNCIQDRMPTPDDKANITSAINTVNDDANMYLDQTTRQNYYRALVLSTVWIDHKITDHELHNYMTNLVERIGMTSTFGKDNKFFYFEIDNTKSQTDLYAKDNAQVWFNKGEQCLAAGGIFREKLTSPKRRSIPSYKDANGAGKQAFTISLDLFGRQQNKNAQYKAWIATNIRQNYQQLEDSLYTIGKVHIFSEK